MRNLSFKHTQRGIGLLELMLTMVIIAIVTMMSVQYFGASKRNTVTSKAVNEIQAIISTVGGMPALSTYLKDSDATNLTNAVAMSGQIPAEYIYDAGSGNYSIGTPWSTPVTTPDPGGDHSKDVTTLKGQFYAQIVTSTHVKVEGASSYATVLQITSKGLPNWGCQSLVDKFQASAKYADCDGNDLVLEYPLTMSGDL